MSRELTRTADIGPWRPWNSHSRMEAGRCFPHSRVDHGLPTRSHDVDVLHVAAQAREHRHLPDPRGRGPAADQRGGGPRHVVPGAPVTLARRRRRCCRHHRRCGLGWPRQKKQCQVQTTAHQENARHSDAFLSNAPGKKNTRRFLFPGMHGVLSSQRRQCSWRTGQAGKSPILYQGQPETATWRNMADKYVTFPGRVHGMTEFEGHNASYGAVACEPVRRGGEPGRAQRGIWREITTGSGGTTGHDTTDHDWQRWVRAQKDNGNSGGMGKLITNMSQSESVRDRPRTCLSLRAFVIDHEYVSV
eukprot:gene4926-biopygen13088